MDLFTRHGVPGSWESGRGGRNKAKVLEVSAKDQAWADAMTAILTKTEAGRGPGTRGFRSWLSATKEKKSPLSATQVAGIVQRSYEHYLWLSVTWTQMIPVLSSLLFRGSWL